MIQFPKWKAIHKIIFCILGFPIQVLSIDTLVQEAIQAFHDNESVSGAQRLQKAPEEKALPVRKKSGKETQASVALVFFSAPHTLEISSWIASKRSSRPEIGRVFCKGPDSKYFKFYGPRGNIKDILHGCLHNKRENFNPHPYSSNTYIQTHTYHYLGGPSSMVG